MQLKKTIEGFKVQDNMPNNSLLIQSHKEELNYTRNENRQKHL